MGAGAVQALRTAPGAPRARAQAHCNSSRRRFTMPALQKWCLTRSPAWLALSPARRLDHAD